MMYLWAKIDPKKQKALCKQHAHTPYSSIQVPDGTLPLTELGLRTPVFEMRNKAVYQVVYQTENGMFLQGVHVSDDRHAYQEQEIKGEFVFAGRGTFYQSIPVGSGFWWSDLTVVVDENLAPSDLPIPEVEWEPIVCPFCEKEEDAKKVSNPLKEAREVPPGLSKTNKLN
jgi:hypothetical protein